MNKTWIPVNAKWIWLAGPDKPANGYARFRKSFQLDRVPSQATLHVSADCKYLLFVNGMVVGRGPITTLARHKQVDPYEIAHLLRQGPNAIAALVLHRQNRNSRFYPERGGFLLQMDFVAALGERGHSLGTDGSWKARWATEYKSNVPNMTHQYGEQEWLDGRLVPIGWQNAEFDDSGWPGALAIADAEKTWPREMELRTVPHMGRKIIHPVRLVCYFGLTSYGKPPETDPEPARHIMTAYPMHSIVVWNTESTLEGVASAVPSRRSSDAASGSLGTADATPTPAVFLEQQGDGVGFVVDLGKEYYGYPFIEFECAGGATVNLGHGEVLSRNRIQTVLMMDQIPEQRYADRYTTRDGRQRWELYDTKGCRYLEIHFHRLADFYTGAKVVIHEVGIIHSDPPFERKSEFSCSDERLNQIWEICSHTAQIMCQDNHICDAQREQNHWPDFIQELLYLQMFGQVEMIRQFTQTLCRVQMKSGFMLCMFPPAVPKRIEEITPEEQYLFVTMAFPIFVIQDWLVAGEDERQNYWLDCCAKTFDFVRRYIGPHGTLANLPGDHWVEWSGMDVKFAGRGAKNAWEMTFWNAWFVFALEQTAGMAESLGRNEPAKAWRELASSVRQATDKRFWSKERQAYIDGIYDGQPSRIVSQTTNAAAVIARLGDERRLRRTLATTEDPKRCDVRSAISMMAFYHEALQSMGMDRLVPERIRERYGRMIDLGATTTWEGEEALERNNGLCLPFSAHPLNYLTRTALGITPLAPGYRRFSVQVVPHGLRHAKGRIATPTGYIEIAWQQVGAYGGAPRERVGAHGGAPTRFEIGLSVPAGCEAHVAPPRIGSRTNPAATAVVDGIPKELTPWPIASCTYVRTEQPALRVAAGKHHVTFL